MKASLAKYQRRLINILWVVGLILWLLLQIFYSYQKRHHQQSQQNLLSLQQNMQRLLPLQPPRLALASTRQSLSLDDVIQQSAQKHHLLLHSVTVEEGGRGLVLSPLPFSQLILWLGELQREQDIRTLYLQVEQMALGEMVRVNKLIVQGITEI